MKKKKTLSEIIIIFLIKFLKYLIISLFIFFIFYTIIYNCFSIFANKEYIEIGKIIFLNSKDNESMKNEINNMDFLIIKKEDFTNIKIGDIIAYKNGKKENNKDIIRIQRVTSIINDNGKTYIQTKGDNNLYPNQEKLTEEEILGNIIIKIPLLGVLKIG